MRFNYAACCISLRNGGEYMSKKSKGWRDRDRPGLLSIESPVDSSMDAGKNSWAIHTVRRAFAHAFRVVSATRGAPESGSAATAASLLACLVYPDDKLLRKRTWPALEDDTEEGESERGGGGRSPLRVTSGQPSSSESSATSRCGRPLKQAKIYNEEGDGMQLIGEEGDETRPGRTSRSRSEGEVTFVAARGERTAAESEELLKA